MEYINLRNNLLFLLANKFVKSGSLGPHQTKLIYAKFSGISNEKVLTDLESLQADGFVAMTPNKDRIYLTERGISQIEFLISTEK
jgi:hypothetical protein